MGTLNDKDSSVRKWNAVVLGEIGKPAQVAVPTLLETVVDEDDEVRRRAVMALDKIRYELAPPEEIATAIESSIGCAGVWQDKGLSVWASNCLANADILTEKQLIERFTTLEEILALRNCGWLMAEEIWSFITNFCAGVWQDKSLSVRASNCLANADILTEEQLIERFTTLEEILALRNCGCLTAEEIWSFITNLNTGLDSTEIQPSYDNLSNRSQNALVKAGVANNEQLVERAFTRRKISNLRSIGVQTCDEIWILVQHLHSRQLPLEEKADTPNLSAYDASQEGQVGENFQEAPRDESVSVPLLKTDSVRLDQIEKAGVRDIPLHTIRLLKTEVSEGIWAVLQKTPIHRFTWHARAENVMNQQSCQTLADLAQISPTEWLELKNFGRKSLAEIQDKVTGVINSPERSNPLSVLGLSVLGHAIF